MKYRKEIKRHDGLHIIEGEDKRKVDALTMSTKGIGAELTEEDKEVLFKGIPELQKEFQKNHCGECLHYDKEKQDFKKKGNPRDQNGCSYHVTDIMGKCWNWHTETKCMEIQRKNE